MTIFKKTLAAILVMAVTGTVAHAAHTVTGDGSEATADITVQDATGVSNDLNVTSGLTAGTVVDNQEIATGTVASKSGTPQQYEVQLTGAAGYGTATIEGKQVAVASYTPKDSDDPHDHLQVAVVSEDSDASKAVDFTKGTVINATAASPSAAYSIVTAEWQGKGVQTVKAGTYDILTTAFSWTE
ncbi:TPA: hypothetical protein U2R15_004165 [Klebsiella aerogenes]|nr:hypothetical protein [Klebsiella aerogenes]